MSKLSVILSILVVSCSLLFGQQTTIIQTPFGPKEVTTPATPVVQAPPAEAPQNPGNAAAQPAPQAGAVVQDGSAPIALRLDNQDIHQVIRIIGDALGLNYIIDPTVKGTVNINTSDTLRRSDLLPILESILKINGATMIRTGNFYQIVPANTASRQPIEVIDRAPQVASDDQVVMQIIRMKYVAASEIGKILTSYLSDAGSITVHETGNIILLTDRRSNIRKLLEIVDIFDTTAFQGEGIRLLPVKNNRARDVVEDLKTIFTGYGLSDKQSAIRFIVIDRLNSVLVVTPNAEVFPEVERWLGVLDQPTVTAGIRHFVYKVKNAKAVDLQRVLSQLYVEIQQAPPQAQAPPLNPALPLQPNMANPGLSGASAQPVSQPAQPAQPAISTVASRNGSMRIIADELNNALVIQATAQEYAEMAGTLEQLDILRRQVLIDAQIFEVVLSDSLQFGVSALLQSRGTLANPQTTGSIGNPPGAALQTFTYVGRARELVMFLNADENRSRVRTLSAPSVLVSDNGTAQFEVGTEVPVPTSSSVTPVQTGGTNLFAQTIEFRDTGVILHVKPQINESGNVTMDVAQEVSSAGANTVSAIVAPVIAKSSVTSTVVVEDGQTIALGGFIRENTELDRDRIPIIGSVPILGALFGTTSKSTSRTELIILITPHVLRTHEDADLATNELKAKLKEMKGFLK
jgi:general secretion pathway protein D